jgi:hypothetical protein
MLEGEVEGEEVTVERVASRRLITATLELSELVA